MTNNVSFRRFLIALCLVLGISICMSLQNETTYAATDTTTNIITDGTVSDSGLVDAQKAVIPEEATKAVAEPNVESGSESNNSDAQSVQSTTESKLVESSSDKIKPATITTKATVNSSDDNKSASKTTVTSNESTNKKKSVSKTYQPVKATQSSDGRIELAPVKLTKDKVSPKKQHSTVSLLEYHSKSLPKTGEQTSKISFVAIGIASLLSLGLLLVGLNQID